MTNDTIIDGLEIREMRREELTFALDLAAVCRTHAQSHTCINAHVSAAAALNPQQCVDAAVHVRQRTLTCSYSELSVVCSLIRQRACINQWTLGASKCCALGKVDVSQCL